jgi:hypothetical protein
LSSLYLMTLSSLYCIAMSSLYLMTLPSYGFLLPLWYLQTFHIITFYACHENNICMLWYGNR